MFTTATAASALFILHSAPYLQEITQAIDCRSRFKTLSILNAENDPHTYFLKPSDRVLFETADMIIITHSDLETWVPKTKQKRLEVAKLLPLRKSSSASPHKHHHHHNHDVDLHIWHSPEFIKQAVDLIKSELVKKIPEKKDEFDQCSNSYKSKILETEKSILLMFQDIPREKRFVFTNHDALGYFTDFISFKLVSLVGLNTNKGPSPAQIKKFSDAVVRSGTKYLFLEQTSQHKHLESISKQTRTALGPKLWADGIGPLGSEASTLTDMWLSNAQKILTSIK